MGYWDEGGFVLGLGGTTLSSDLCTCHMLTAVSSSWEKMLLPKYGLRWIYLKRISPLRQMVTLGRAS